MKYYIFKMTYSNGKEFTKQINANSAFDAWQIYSKWITGFVYTDDNAILTNVDLTVEA